MKSVIFSLLLLALALPLSSQAQQTGSLYDKSVQNANLSPPGKPKLMELESKTGGGIGI